MEGREAPIKKQSCCVCQQRGVAAMEPANCLAHTTLAVCSVRPVAAHSLGMRLQGLEGRALILLPLGAAPQQRQRHLSTVSNQS